MSINEYEIRVFGMKRSGNHAIINWIASLFDEPVYFFNNCGYGCDPYKTGRTPGIRWGTPIKDIFVKVGKLKNRNDKLAENVRMMKKKCIIYSYENTFLPQLLENPITQDYEKTIVSSEKIFDVVILRDVFNWAASHFIYMPHGRKGPVDNSLLDLKDYIKRRKLLAGWKSQALEFIGQTNILRDKKICISYNDWFSNESYREKIASKFNLINRNYSLATVAGVGNRGSKFDAFDFEGKAAKMSVLERWKVFENDNLFWKMIFEDKSIPELSNKIFGDVLKGDIK